MSSPPDEEIDALRAELASTRKALEIAEARARAQEQAGNLGLWELDPATARGSWSPKMFEIFHQDPQHDEPAVTDMDRIVHPEDVPTFRKNRDELVATGHAPPIVFRTNPDLGPVRHVRGAVIKVESGDGGTRIFGAAADITQQIELRGDLELSARTLEAVYAHSPFTVVAVEPDRTVSFVSRVADGYDRDQIIGEPYNAAIAEHDRARTDAGMARALQGHTDVHHEVEDVGGRHWETRYGPVLNEAGEVERVLCFTVDVTEQRKLEAQMQHAQKLESLGVLAGGIAHDFNNLLVAILGNAELALMDLGASNPAWTCLDEIMTCAHRAADLCRQMLAYSGKGRFIVQAVGLPGLVREMANLLEVSISKGVALRYEFEAKTRPVEADVTQLRQVVMNLITNASDAIGNGEGIITIATGTGHCDRDYLAQAYLRDDLPEGEYTFLEVSDTGCGMDEDTRDRMFEPFFTSKDDGRGLGLAAVLGIVRSHRGAIRVYSEPGKGTTIKVLLPSTEVRSDAPVTDSSAPRVLTGRGVILVVDDEKAIRSLAKRTLEKAGFEVVTANDGVEALERFREQDGSIGGVLLDMTMPRMDGKTTFAELRKLDPDVRVLLSSGYNEQEATSRFAGKGLAGFIQKPYRASELIEALRELLDVT